MQHACVRVHSTTFGACMAASAPIAWACNIPHPFASPAPPAAASAAADRNLKVWRLADGHCVLRLHQKMFSRDAWPSVQFAGDEARAFHMVTNTVHIYACADWEAGVSQRVAVKGVAGFAACPAPASTLLAAYVPEAKGSPGFVALYDYATAASGEALTPICRKGFFRVRRLGYGCVGGRRISLPRCGPMPRP